MIARSKDTQSTPEEELKPGCLLGDEGQPDYQIPPHQLLLVGDWGFHQFISFPSHSYYPFHHPFRYLYLHLLHPLSQSFSLFYLYLA
jgi:hypothetical protein